MCGTQRDDQTRQSGCHYYSGACAQNSARCSKTRTAESAQKCRKVRKKQVSRSRPPLPLSLKQTGNTRATCRDITTDPWVCATVRSTRIQIRRDKSHRSDQNPTGRPRWKMCANDFTFNSTYPVLTKSFLPMPPSLTIATTLVVHGCGTRRRSRHCGTAIHILGRPV